MLWEVTICVHNRIRDISSGRNIKLVNLLFLFVCFKTRKLITFIHAHWHISVTNTSELSIAYESCPESIQPFLISREPVAWPWCNLAAIKGRPYCTSVNSHSPVGLVIRQWDAVDWVCVLCDRRIHNDRASRSASSRQSACPFYSCRAGFFGKASHHPGLSALLQPRFDSLRLPAFLKAKIVFEREEICEYDGHTANKVSEWRLTDDWLYPRESDCSRMRSKVSSDWLPSYIKATWPVLEIFKMAGYFPDSPLIHY